MSFVLILVKSKLNFPVPVVFLNREKKTEEFLSKMLSPEYF